jgi:transcriptional regulator with XRE-family HTH domain
VGALQPAARESGGQTNPLPTETLRCRFGENLRALREQGGLSMGEVSRRSGVSRSEISRLEAGLREPRLTTIVQLARALDIEEVDLIRGLG